MPSLLRNLLAASAFAWLAACGGGEHGQSDQPGMADEEPRTPAISEGTDTSTANTEGEREDLPPFGEPPIWTVADADTTVHLFGTVHILKPETEWKTSSLQTVLGELDALYFEADVASEEAATEMARLVPQLGVFQDGTKLSDLLEPEELREVEEAAELIGLPFVAIEPMKPWLATVQMSVLALQRQGYAADSGVETTDRKDNPYTRRSKAAERRLLAGARSVDSGSRWRRIRARARFSGRMSEFWAPARVEGRG